MIKRKSDKQRALSLCVTYFLSSGITSHSDY